MSYLEIEAWKEAIKIREKYKYLKQLQLNGYANMNTKKHYRIFENEQKKLINEINFSLGEGIKIDNHAVSEFKKLRRGMKFKRG
jgi:hypothetical protein